MTIPEHRKRLQTLGVLLLLAGLGAGGFLSWRSFQTGTESEEIVRAQEQSRAYELAMQKNVGPVGLIMSRWSDRLTSPQAVAIEAALAGGLAAGVCFVLAARPPRE